MGAVIELEHVEKTFVVRRKAGRLRRTRTEVRAVDDVSFEVPAGSMVGYIGPNRGVLDSPTAPGGQVHQQHQSSIWFSHYVVDVLRESHRHLESRGRPRRHVRDYPKLPPSAPADP
jgi:ABC-type microcin C transport system duplicated ATPase subunit YejF